MDRASPVTRRSFLSGISGALGATIFFQSSDGRQTGGSDYPIGLPFERLWESNISDLSSDSTIHLAQIDQGTIYLIEQGSSTSVIHALRQQDLETLWSTTHDGQLQDPKVAGDRLFALHEDVFLAFKLSTRSNTPEWLANGSIFNPGEMWDIAVSDSHVWFLEYNVEKFEESSNQSIFGEPTQIFEINTAKLHCYTLDGNKRWSRDALFGERKYSQGMLIGSAEKHRKRADQKNYDLTSGHVEVRDAATGDIRWRSPDQDITRAVLPRESKTEQVIGVATDGGLYGYDLNSGAERWHHSVESEPTDITAGGSRVYIGLNQTIIAYNPSTDEIEWRRQTPSVFDLTYRERLIYVGGQNGNIRAFDARTGEQVWGHSLIASGNTYEWVGRGTLYCVSGSWMAGFQGSKGKAIYKLRDIQSNSSPGTHLADVAGRRDAITTARNAVDNENYDTALAAINRAQTLKTVGDSLVWAGGGGITYVGSRRGMHERKQRIFEDEVERLTTVYPVSKGVLKGMAPDELITTATDAVEEYRSAWIGRPLTVGWIRDDPYTDLRESVKTATQLGYRIENASTTLEGFPSGVHTDWETHLNKILTSGQYDELTNSLSQLETAAELVSLRKKLVDSHTQLVTDELSELMDKLLTPTSDISETDIEYCEAACAAIEEFETAQTALTEYDLEELESKIQESLEAVSTKRDAAIRNLARIQDILTIATTIESIRTELNLQYLDITTREIRSNLQGCLTHLDMNQLSELKSLVENLDSGVWSYSDLQKFTPTEFEHLVATLYDAQGYETEVTQASNDMGIDVKARDDSETLAIQVKQYSHGNKVGRPTVQQLAGARDQINANKGIIVTSSSFTDTAISASQSYGMSMKLIDADDLCTLLTKSPVSPPTVSSDHSGGTSSSYSGAGGNQRYSGAQGGSHFDGTKQEDARSGIQYCMTCGQGYRGNLEEVTDPNGETMYVCAQCKELIEQTEHYQQAAAQEAYDILDVSPPSTQDEIETAYREKARETHPDTGGSKDDFLEVQRAYETLTKSD